jgi:hypothetical protein
MEYIQGKWSGKKFEEYREKCIKDTKSNIKHWQEGQNECTGELSISEKKKGRFKIMNDFKEAGLITEEQIAETEKIIEDRESVCT